MGVSLLNARGSDPSNYRNNVFETDKPLEEQLLQVREYALTLRECLSEDARVIADLQRRIEHLEGVRRLRAYKKAPPAVAERA